MTDETGDEGRWHEIDELFAAALELPEEERSGFLDAESPDPDVRARVEALLDAEQDFATGRLLGRGPLAPRELVGAIRRELESGGVRSEEGEPDRAGERVGPYLLERRLGQGGMATVYLARRVEGGFEQQVAIKLIRGDVSSAEVVRRFRSEREILSSLRHPNIARLLDGGATSEGVPYLVMDPVEGVPVTEYCRGHEVDLEGRLWLFLEIVQAVGYAHRNLVVHRDLKPSNILVTGEGRPMLLDFGIAKLLGEGQEGVGATRTRARWMTPGYGAPEQIREGHVTTATDVYQLGVLLYELLAGARPFPVEGRSVFEVEQAICEEDPPRPSRSGSRFVGRLSGDLDAIVLKALRKEPDDRYPSVEAMAADVRRHLTSEPVEARKGGRAYRARKFVRRHRGAAAAVGVFVLLVTAWAVTATVQGTRLARERDRARAESEKATRVTAFLTSLMEAEDPRQAQGDTVSVREVLERGVQRIGDELEGQPDVQAELYLTTGSVYRSLGDLAAADSLLQRALEIREELYGEGPDEELAEVQIQVGRLRLDQGRFADAEPLMAAALEQRRVLLPSGSEAIADDMVELGDVRRIRGRYDEAEALYRDAVAMYEALDGPLEASIAITRNNLALVYHETGRFAEALPLYEEAVGRLRDTLGPRHPYTLILQHNLAGFNRSLGRYAISDSIFREVVALEREVHPGTLDMAAGLANLGMTLRFRGRYDEASALLEEALDVMGPLDPTHPSVTLRLRNLARVRVEQRRYDEARALLDDFGRRRVERVGPTGDISAQQDMALVLREMGRYEESARILRAVVERRREQFEAPHPGIAEALEELGRTRWAAGSLDEADALLREALAMRRESGVDLPVAEGLTWLAALARERGQLDEAGRLLDEVAPILAALPPETVYEAELELERARLALARGNAEEALEGIRAVRPWYDRELSDVHPERATVLGLEGEALMALGRLSDAEPLLRASDRVLREASAREAEASARRLSDFAERAGRRR